MRIFKLSLGNEFFDENSVQQLASNQLVSVHPDTPSKGQMKQTQGELYLSAEKGDVLYVCRSNHSVEYIAFFTDERPLFSLIEGHEDWIDRSIEIIYSALEPEQYDRNLDRWWTPRNNSTFVKVPENEYESFETAILQPVFEKSLEDVIKRRNNLKDESWTKNINDYKLLQEYFSNLRNNPERVYKEVNQLDEIDIRKIYYSYIQRGDVSGQPVVLLRKQIIEELYNGNEITTQIVERLREEIAASFEKDVFKSWKDSFRVMYTFLYDKYKNDLINFFHDLIHRIQGELEIEHITDFNLVHFDGAQNQGFDHIWFAIYNNTYSSQRYAKQLFFRLQGSFTYGLYNGTLQRAQEIHESESFDYNEIIRVFEEYKNEVIKDNSMEQARIAKLIDVLIYKRQVILKGPPGTGKTFSAEKIAKQITGDDDRVKIIQFHPSFSYEDFVRGIKATSKGGNIIYETENKTLANFAEKASLTEDAENEKYVLIIDEINRANLPSVLGELIYALEYRDKKVESLYAKDGDYSISIPENLYIIGTMNTADRSIGHIDYAIKRRFAFIDILPDESVITTDFAKKLFKEISKLFFKLKSDDKKINSEYLAGDFDYKDVQLGHSYFILSEGTEEEQKSELKLRLKYEIMPILREYVKDGLLLESANQKLDELENFEI